MTLYVGTSGFAYREWKPAFYPQEIPQRRFLEYYAHKLTACEINATFYRLQSEATIARWAEAAPQGFRFAPKAHRRLTHARRLDYSGDQGFFLDAFLRSLSGLGPRLAVVLFQFPPYRSRNDEALGALLAKLPPGPVYAFEFRNESWASPEVTEAIVEAGGSVCLSETSGAVPRSLPEGSFAYVRLRADRYPEPVRLQWRDLLVAESRGRDVYAFAKHEGVVEPDDPSGGVGLATWLGRNRR